MKGKKVLLVDADPQGSLSISLGHSQPDRIDDTLATLMSKVITDTYYNSWVVRKWFQIFNFYFIIKIYKEIVNLRPDWHSDELMKGKIKIVMTGSSSDPEDWQKYIGTKANRETLAKRMKDKTDELQLVKLKCENESR